MNGRLILQQIADYNMITEEVLEKIDFQPYRNHLDLLWVRGALSSLKENVGNLLKKKIWTKKEKFFLNKLNELILSKLKKENYMIKITPIQARQLLGLSIEAIIDRDIFTQKDILDNPKEYNVEMIDEILFLLNSSATLLALIKGKVEENKIESKDFKNVANISKRLATTYFFILGKLGRENIEDSLLEISDIIRDYYNLNHIIV